MAKLERDFQRDLINEISNRFPGTVVLKNDPGYLQGFPDLTILFPNGKWAELECNKNSKAHKQPNQEEYIETLNVMGFARFIFPENKEEVLNELQWFQQAQ
jgi:hypothetical protein